MDYPRKNMALITSDCATMCIHEHRMALITSECVCRSGQPEEVHPGLLQLGAQPGRFYIWTVFLQHVGPDHLGLCLNRCAAWTFLCDSSRHVYDTTAPTTCLPHTRFAGAWTPATHAEFLCDRPMDVSIYGLFPFNTLALITSDCVQTGVQPGRFCIWTVLHHVGPDHLGLCSNRCTAWTTPARTRRSSRSAPRWDP